MSHVKNSNWSKKHQASFRTNSEAIFNGNFPERYLELRKLTPGRKVLDIGSADGTFALSLTEVKESVYGVELTKERFDTAVRLQTSLCAKAPFYKNCNFYQGGIQDHLELIGEVDTVTFIRVAYYLPMESMLEHILTHENVNHVLLCGNYTREQRARRSWLWSRARRQFKLAREDGMVSLMKACNVNDFEIIRMGSTGDPVLIARLPRRTSS